MRGFVALLTFAAVACAGRGDAPEEGKTAMPDLKIVPPSYLDDAAPAPYRLRDGTATFRARVFGEKEFVAPATQRRCVFWWLEVFHEAADAHHQVFMGDADVPIYVQAGNVLVKVEGWAVRHTRADDFVRTFQPGAEPDTRGLVPVHSFPETTWREWILEPGVEYEVTVTRGGEALPPEKPGGEPTYTTYYHFTFAP